jgi:hypothetical protein
MFPRQDVVDNVLLSNVYCVSAEPTIVLQSEEGQPSGSETSFSGYCVGDIIITTSGVANFTVNADGQVTEGPDERSAVGIPLTIPFDGAPPDVVPPLVTVVSPNGGEQWVAGSLHDILWAATDSVGVASYAIDYSINAGSDWISIVGQSAGNPGSYAWNLPQNPSDDCLVKVTSWDAAGNYASDVSNSIFSIVASNDSIAPSVTVISPNGGEVWFSGEIDTIRWTATDNVGVATYSISYTTNNGGSWNTIQARTAGNPQVYPWLIPDIVTSNCKVRVIVWDEVQHLASDISNAPFRIHFPDHEGPIVDVILPDGGEVWTVASSRYVFWSASDTSGVDSVALFYSPDAGNSWNTIFPYTHNNLGFYLWTVPDSRTRLALIRLDSKDALGNESSAISQAVFTIRKSPAIDRIIRALPLAR